MFLEPLQRHLAVCAQRDVPGFARSDPDFWNVISIREPSRPRIERRGLKKIHTTICYDVVGTVGLDEGHAGIPRKEHIQAAFLFADSVAGEPLLIHCWAGVSRSAAIALGLIIRSMHLDGYSTAEMRTQGPELLLAIRPQAIPNPLILELCLSEFLTPTEAKDLTIGIVNLPAFFANRFKGAEPR